MSSYPPDLEHYVEQKIQSGEFSSRDDFAAEAVRLYRQIEERHRRLKADIDMAQQQVAQGATAPLDLDALKNELLDQLDEQGNPR